MYVVCLIKMILLEKKSGDERADGSMMNEKTSITSEKKGGEGEERYFVLPEVTYPWTVSCLEYGIAR